MVDTRSDLLARLAKLSPREQQVLALRCQGMAYGAISKAIHIALSTVKEDMGRVYLKLGLDILHPSERLKVLYDTYCPLLKEPQLSPEVLEGEVVSEEPPSIPKAVEEMVNEDEKAMVRRDAAPLVKPDRGHRSRSPLILAIGLGLGACVGGGLVYLALQTLNGGRPTVAQMTSTQAVPTPIQADTVLPAQAAETTAQTPLVVVVTATAPEATQVPSLTPLPQPEMLFFDNFEQGLSASWSVVSGSPVVVNGWLTASENTWLRIGDASWTDYTISFDAVPNDCWFYETWSAVGLRVADMDNMVAFLFAACENEWDYFKNGSLQEVPNSHMEPGTDYDMAITITVRGGQLTVNINGERMSSFFDTASDPGGIALRVGRETQIDNFRVSEVQP